MGSRFCAKCGYEPTTQELEQSAYRCPECGHDPVGDEKA